MRRRTRLARLRCIGPARPATYPLPRCSSMPARPCSVRIGEARRQLMGCGPQMCDLSSTRRRTSRPVVGSLQLLKERPVPLVPGIPAGRGTHDECCVPLSSVSEETAALRIVARRGARIPRFSLYYEGPLDSPSPLALSFRPASPAVRTRAPARDGWRSVSSSVGHH